MCRCFYSSQGWYKYLLRRKAQISLHKKLCRCWWAQVLGCHSGVAQSLPCAKQSSRESNMAQPRWGLSRGTGLRTSTYHPRLPPMQGGGTWWLVQSKATHPIGTPFGGGRFRSANPFQCCTLEQASRWSKSDQQDESAVTGLGGFKADH